MWNTIYHNSQRQETLWKKAPFRIGNLIISSFFIIVQILLGHRALLVKSIRSRSWQYIAIHASYAQVTLKWTSTFFCSRCQFLTNWQKNKVQYFNRRISISIWVARKRQIYFCIQNHCFQKARHPQSTQYLWQISQVRKAKRWKPNLITNC